MTPDLAPIIRNFFAPGPKSFWLRLPFLTSQIFSESSSAAKPAAQRSLLFIDRGIIFMNMRSRMKNFKATYWVEMDFYGPHTNTYINFHQTSGKRSNSNKPLNA